MHATAWVLLWNGGAAAWGGAVGRACGQGALCVLGVWAVCRLWSRMPAAGRAWLWWLACLKLAVGLLCVTPITLRVLPRAPQAPPVLLARLSPALPVTLAPKPLLAPTSGGARHTPPAP
ncbi:MAG: hypothetical protein JO250_11145, partial [Armatimonadetes bacterium]|nr:hypothetical protein [Armatimonadota bacterium]